MFVMLSVCLFLISGSVLAAGTDARERAAFRIDLAETDVANYRIVDVRKSGARGDGTSDDTAAIQKAVDNAGPGTVIRFPAGNYLITSPVLIRKSDIVLEGDRARVTYRPSSDREYRIAAVKGGKPTGNKISSAAFMVVGDMDTLKAKMDTESIGSGDRVIRFRNGAGNPETGDLILIAAKDSGKTVKRKKENLSLFREQNFITVVTKKAGNTLDVADDISIPFDAANQPSVFRMRPVKNVVIRGMDITVDSGKGLHSGILFAFAKDSFVSGSTVRNTSRSGISMISCYRCGVSGNTVSDSVRFGSAEGLGINLERSHFCVVSGNTLSNHRHGILLNHGNGNCLIEGNRISQSKTGGSIDVHGEYNFFNTIRDNTISGGKTGIVIGGGGDVHYNDGPNNAVIGNTIDNCDTGLEFANESLPVIVGKNRFRNMRKSEIEWNNIDREKAIILEK